MPSPLQTPDYQALATFGYAQRKLLRFSKEFLGRKTNLTPEQYEALLALKTYAPPVGLLVGEISERLQVKHHTAVALTDRLAARKLVTKERGRADRRQVFVQLTAAGVILIEAVAAVHRDALRLHISEILRALTHVQKSE
jgi:DNA-binding MarR family transcriptional regulator